MSFLKNIFKSITSNDYSEPRQDQRNRPNFVVCVSRVLSSEGGYGYHPADPGGATNYGITEKTARRHGYMGDMRDLPREKAIQMYKDDYWLPTKCDQMPQAVAFQYFDACVNHGPGRAAKMLQKALGLPEDGIVGPKTLNAANNCHEGQFIAQFNSIRIRFYTGLNTFPSFGKGWMNRVSDNLAWGAEDVI